MSLDISLVEEVHSQNITHNLGPMAEKAGIYGALWRPEETVSSAKELAEKLKPAIADMKARPEFYKQFDSPNGWGLYEHFVPWLDELYLACLENPDAKVCASV